MKRCIFRTSTVIALVCCLIGLVYLLPAASWGQPGKTVTWKAATFTGPAFWSTATVLWLAEQVKAKTNGRFTIEVYPGGSSGIDQPGALSAVRDGIMDMIWCWGPPVASELQAFETQSLPALVPGDLKIHRRVAEAVTPEMTNILKKQGIFLYFYTVAEPRQIFSLVPINNRSEMRGKKIRCLGALESDFTQKLGAAPISVNSADVYTALQQGVIDGAWITDAASFTYKWYEVTKFIIDVKDNGATAGLLVSQEAFDRLPADLRSVLLELQPQFAEKLYENMFALAAKSRSALQEKGMQVLSWPEEDMRSKREVGSSIWENWYKKANADAKKVFDLTQKTLKEMGQEK